MENDSEEKLLRRSVMRFAITRIERLATEVIDQIKQYPACAMLSDNDYAENLWDDYCYDQQIGPVTFLDFAWSDLFAPHLKALIESMDRTEAILLTFDWCWGQGEDPISIIGDPPTRIDTDALAAEVMSVVNRMALDREWLEDSCDDDYDNAEEADSDLLQPPQFAGPIDYLDHLADALCCLLVECSDNEREGMMDDFRMSARQLEIDDVSLGHETTDEGEVRVILSENNAQAMNWARECLDLGTAAAVDLDDAITVLDRFFRPSFPGCRAREG
ncbi:hypothetical protein IP81_15800 [Novosphingobium sp. AAP83]|uniref:hypothetical protein n=1 Tax=Novosphingobium sp. AAP83 TaxID=1523425 RepID=UPI0006B92F39|nr:hypothetical protein [Novosphingobium sp. AAP83]KPF90207.1 hypothetical protein IP81_15800 [Novosphingobium sp. AAP83]